MGLQYDAEMTATRSKFADISRSAAKELRATGRNEHQCVRQRRRSHLATRLNVSITGGGFSGSMLVTFGGARQTVLISTEGISMKSVTVTLSKG